ncbi:ATP-binding cassette domain-containing protein [Effusibacillus lacus]|uniref:ABC transporter ATP-binding protein n=1 Tax=Effusibacillus lacus TaxID=1348429 RepID=A0A292YN84_9BACL|nr:ATP-binding cassette domain-containing protein [Effusibacillus lacus]TCS71228.1 cobalt/nickel transport system ATP-binding protein [Effusibacillus lacus]GAX89854.1 cobalt ABC transporter ATPase [Effusibacillus lacus]
MLAIEVEHLIYQYPDSTRALDDISFQIPAGTKAAILGPNGAGKSTLMHHLNGLLLPQQGTVRIMGETVNRKTAAAIRRKVGLVFQDPDDQVFSSTVWDDVAFGPANMGLDEEEISLRCDTALGAVGMREFKNKPPYHLSYGQKKRVAIAGVMAMHPDVIILDEPMAYLDPRGKDEVASLLQGLSFMGKTILIATHDVDFAAAWADAILLMKDRKLLASGGTELLVERKYIEQADLHLPRVARPFQMVPALKVERLPRNDQEAARLLWNLVCKK